MNPYNRCPCCSKAAYRVCCKPYHDGGIPKTALALMRSRYSAYALNLVDYVVDTTHPTHPQYDMDIEAWKAELREFHDATKFEGLEILEFVDGATESQVSFLAKLTQQGKDVSFAEKSKFSKDNDRWFYRSGEAI